MYVVPLLIIILVALGMFFSPIVAVIIFVIGFAIYLAVAVAGRGGEEATDAGTPEARAAERGRSEEHDARIR
jgi:hypothetical protein